MSVDSQQALAAELSIVRMPVSDAGRTRVPDADQATVPDARTVDAGEPWWGGATFDAVLFDLDGTLVRSGQAVLRSWLTWADENGVEPQRLAGYHGVPAAQIVADLLDEEQVPAAVERIEQLEVSDVDDIVPLPGAVRALAALDPGRSAIVTSCTAPLAAARISASGLTSPAVVVTAGDVEVGKPDPAPFLLAARRLGVDPERCLVVEDAVSGLAAGRAAGMATLALSTTYDADRLTADVVVADLDAVRFEQTADGVRVGPA